MERPRTFEAVKALLPDFKAAYLERPPVIGAGLGAETTRRGSHKFVFRAYLEGEPTPDQQETLKKTFRRVPVRYEAIGPIVAAGAAPTGDSFEERFPELAKVQTLAELNELVRKITPEEQTLIDSIDFNAPPTPEELVILGPDFFTKLLDRSLRRLHTSTALDK